MKRHKLLSWVLSLVMALTVFSIPAGSAYAVGEEGDEGEPEYCIGWWEFTDGSEDPIVKTTSNGETIDYSRFDGNGFRVFVKQDGQWATLGGFIDWRKTSDTAALFGYTDENGKECTTSDSMIENADTALLLPQEAGTVTLTAYVYEDYEKMDLAAELSVTVSVSQSYLTSKYNGYLNFWDMNAAYANYTERSLYGSLPNVQTYNSDRGKKPPINKSDLANLKITVKVGTNEYHPVLNTEEEWEDYEFIVDFSKATNVKLGTRVTITYSLCGVTRTEKRTVAKWVTPKLTAKSYTYDGKTHKAVPTVKVGSVTLKRNTEYYVDSASRKNVGTGTYWVWSDDENSKYLFYDRKGTFKINPKGTSLKQLKREKKAFTAKWAKQSAKMSTSRITGYQIMYATNKSFTKGKKTVTVKGYATTSKKIKNLKKKKVYYVKVRTYKTVGKVKYYSKWSKVMSVKTK